MTCKVEIYCACVCKANTPALYSLKNSEAGVSPRHQVVGKRKPLFNASNSYIWSTSQMDREQAKVIIEKLVERFKEHQREYKMSWTKRIQDCIDNHDAYVLILAAMPDKKLAYKLETIELQLDLAVKTKNEASYELLEIWRAQTIEARTYKAVNNIADAPNEMELAIANIETFVAETEKRQEVLKEYINPDKPARTKANERKGKDEQLSFF